MRIFRELQYLEDYHQGSNFGIIDLVDDAGFKPHPVMQ